MRGNLFGTIAALLCGCAIITTQAGSVYGDKTVQELTLESLAKTGKTACLSLESTPPSQFAAPALKLSTTDDGDILNFQSDQWGKAKCLAFDIYYDADHSGMFALRAYAKGEQRPRIYAVIGLLPRLNTRVTFPLSLLDGQSVFMDRDPGRLKGVVQGKRLYLDELDRISLSVSFTGLDPQQVVYINNVALLNDTPEYKLPDVKMVDVMGQNTQKEWSGKTPNLEALNRQLKASLAEAKDAKRPETLSQYGGTKKKRFDASGFFRVEHDGKRWWMVDPEGYGFFSIGMDCVCTGETGRIIPGMEPLFEWLPTNDDDFKASLFKDWRGDTVVSFSVANLIRVFGPKDWKDNWRTMTQGRLIDWGFNTIGNWSETDVFRGHHFPYVIPLGGYPASKTMLFRDFPDIFSPEFKENSIRYAKGLEGYKDDPWLIGYFMRNEPEWGFGYFNLASEMLEANPGTATRKVLAERMRSQYKNDIAALNAAWKTDLKSFDELVNLTFRQMETKSKQAKQDLWKFSEEMVSTYVNIPAAELRKVDSNHLNLGMRYAWIASDLMYKAGEVFDVFTINCYDYLPNMKSIDTIAQKCGKPTLIGEFHFGALDRGLTATGLKAVTSQKERGLAYRRYLEMGAANPNFLGAHYFILNDQALLGRFDGENYQIGFVDVALMPYQELVDAAIETHGNIYDIMLGEKEPYNTPAQAIRNISF